MSTKQIICPTWAEKIYLPGFEPASLDPVLKAFSENVPESVIRLSLGLSPVRTRPKKRKEKKRHTVVSPALPLLTAHLKRQGGYYPDAVIDTEDKRQRDSQKVLCRLEKLAMLYPNGLKLYRLTLSELDELCLYDPETVKAAKKVVRRWLKARGLRGEFKLERGRCGTTHVHVVTCATADASGSDVYNLEGLACYLVKPADARACMVKKEEKWVYSAASLKQQKDLAAEAWLQAEVLLTAGRFGKRDKLPRMHGPCS